MNGHNKGERLLDAFDQTVRNFPDAIAVEFEDSVASFAALGALANQAATALAGLPVYREPLVVLVLGVGISRIAAFIGALRLGLIYTVIEPDQGDRDIERILNDSECSIAVFADNELARFESMVPAQCTAIAASALVESDDPVCPSPHANNDILYLRYTSGSTGVPKAAIHKTRTAQHLLRAYADQFDFGPGQRVGMLNAFWHACLHAIIFSGATLCLFDLRRHGYDAMRQWIKASELTTIMLFPTALRTLYTSLEPGERLKTITTIGISGERMRAADYAATQAHFGEHCELVNSYSCSELIQMANYRFQGSEDFDDANMPTGYASADVTLEIDPSVGAPNTRPVTGEIIVHSPYMTSGYWKRPDLTSKRYICDPRTGEPVGLRTGDVGWIDDHRCLFVEGRLDRQVKINNNKVQLDMVEARLASHPDIHQAAVQTDATGTALIAYVVPASDTWNERALRAHAARHLPRIMLPGRYVELESLPLLASGKVDFRHLPAPPSLPDTPQHTPWVNAWQPTRGAQRSDLENELIHLWQQVLGVSPVDLDDNFFELGGTSLTAATLAGAMAPYLGVPLDAGHLFEFPSIRTLIDQASELDPDAPLLVPMNSVTDGAPLVFLRGIYVYRELVAELDLNRPILAIHVPEKNATRDFTNANATLAARIPPLVSRYVELIAERFPGQCIDIGGFSFAGILAIDVAARLECEGVNVASVLLLDSLLPDGFALCRKTWISHHVKKLAQPGKILRHLKAAEQAEPDLPRLHDLDVLRYYSPDIPNAAKNIVLFKANADKPWLKARDGDYGWRARLGRDLAVHQISGTHMEIMQQPHIKLLGRALRTYVDTA